MAVAKVLLLRDKGVNPLCLSSPWVVALAQYHPVLQGIRFAPYFLLKKKGSTAPSVTGKEKELHIRKIFSLPSVGSPICPFQGVG